MSRKAVRRTGAVFLAVLTLFALSPVKAFAARPTGTATALPATGSFTLNGVVQQFSGVFNLQKFDNQNGQLVAVGTLTDTVTGASLPLTLPVTVQQAGSCEILDLTLGPLHLDLLGLVIDLNAIHLNITAQQGPGNLLGNLLCAVANLLNGTGGGGGGGGLNAIVALLNQILGILQGL
jgi:hypothetical protein